MTSAQLQHKRNSSHRGTFFKHWLQDPFHVASIAPSSRSLAKLMARGVRSGDRVIELGAGTGTVTDAILERGVRPEDLFLVEQNAAFASILRHRFPRTTVVQADAADLTTPLRALRGSVDWVISGLPILWFSKEKKTRIVEEAFSLLSAAGGFQQFTYLGRPPVGQRLLTGLGLRAALLGITPLNLPPAFVYRFSRLAA